MTTKAGDLAFLVDIEDPEDPYGYGIGYVKLVLAKNAKTARAKANAYSNGYRAYKVRLATDEDIIL